MIIGKWNKSVILTYIGMAISILGIYLSFAHNNRPQFPLCCLMVAGICDLFDGFIARKCKRTEEEKEFGVWLDGLVDTISFIALPIVIFISTGLTAWYHLVIYWIFAICGIARLGFFNITLPNHDKPVSHYRGLPVTYSALVFPIFYLLYFYLPAGYFQIVLALIILIVALCNVLNIKIKKPNGIAYAVFSIMAIIMLVVYIGVL